MDMSQPISTVVPSLDGPVLQVLARTSRPLTGRRVHSLTGAGSEAGVRRVLNRLGETGLVTVEEAGASLLYALNRDHLAASAVQQLANLRGLLVDRLRATIENWRQAPVHASLFGSTARGDGDLSSDVDLLLVHPPLDGGSSGGWHEQVSDLADHVLRWTGNTAQSYQLSPTEFAQHVLSREPIVDEWIRDAVTLVGPGVRELRNTTFHGGGR